MNANELASAMEHGAQLRKKWKPRTFQNPRRIYVLTYPDGTTVNVQKSTVDAAIGTNQIYAAAEWSGGIVDYAPVRVSPVKEIGLREINV